MERQKKGPGMSDDVKPPGTSCEDCGREHFECVCPTAPVKTGEGREKVLYLQRNKFASEFHSVSDRPLHKDLGHAVEELLVVPLSALESARREIEWLKINYEKYQLLMDDYAKLRFELTEARRDIEIHKAEHTKAVNIIIERDIDIAVLKKELTEARSQLTEQADKITDILGKLAVAETKRDEYRERAEKAELKLSVARESIESLQGDRAKLTAANEKLERYEKALQAVQAYGLAHYEDCLNASYDDESCSCGMEKIELLICKALDEGGWK